MKLKNVIRLGYSNHDCCMYYKCPYCDETFDSWALYWRKDNNHCPKCGEEFEGIYEYK